MSKQVIDDPRIVTIPGGQFDALFVADVIISDYSTVIYEAGLLDIPVYLYAYDWDYLPARNAASLSISKTTFPRCSQTIPTHIIKAIEDKEFDAEAYRVFENANVTLPENASCTETICEVIIRAATPCKKKS